MDTKRCHNCKEVKAVGEFSKDRTQKDGLQAQCKACHREYSREYRAANREAIAEKKREYMREYYAANREALAEKNREYHAANREALAEKKREYHAANRVAIAERMREYYAANREKMREYYAANRENRAAYIRNRRKTNVWVRIANSLRTRQYKFFRGTSRPASMVRDMGCQPEFFLRHIDSLLTGSMAMENYGTVWHLDHIYPLARVDLTDRVQFLAAANWRNLQPMLGPENLEKSNAVTPEAQRLFDDLLREFASKEVA